MDVFEIIQSKPTDSAPADSLRAPDPVAKHRKAAVSELYLAEPLSDLSLLEKSCPELQCRQPSIWQIGQNGELHKAKGGWRDTFQHLTVVLLGAITIRSSIIMLKVQQYIVYIFIYLYLFLFSYCFTVFFLKQIGRPFFYLIWASVRS